MPSVLESLNSALRRAFEEDTRVYLLGEDILDPYGGAFKVTRGLSTRYPDRVLTTPISEAGFVGVAAGMALRGLRPVVEIMFGDFTTLIADQLINHISKFRWMYNEQVSLPIVIRTPMGGRRGYGPTHSQTLEKLYLGVPGLQVVAPAALSLDDGSGSPGDVLYHLVRHGNVPTLFIENKLQYLLPVQSQGDLKDFKLTRHLEDPGPRFPWHFLSIKGAPQANLTIAAYGYMAELVKQAAIRLAFEQEIFVELVIPTRLSPFDMKPILASAGKSGALLVVEEGSVSLGWGSEVLARLEEIAGPRIVNMKRLAAKEVPVPFSRPLEEQALPGVEHIFQAAKQMIK